MEVCDLSLDGLKVIVPQIYPDARGFFYESYRKNLYAASGIDVEFVQDNVSYSKKDTIRALHFQSFPGQDKLVSCLGGEIWDVAVDLRLGSKTYLSWEAMRLSSANKKQLFIPKGFAHGFCVLSETAIVQYKVSHYYNPATEKSIRWNDPKINIDWPCKHPIVSKRDQESPFLEEIEGAILDYRK